MTTFGWVLSITGTAITFVCAVWLLRGFSPTDPRFTDDGQNYPGTRTSVVVPNLLRAQRKVSGVLALGASVQLVGVVMMGHN